MAPMLRSTGDRPRGPDPRPVDNRAPRQACGRETAHLMGESGSLPTLQDMSPVPRPTAAFFDLDKTIIAKSSTLAFSREFQAGGLISRGAVLRSAYAQFVYLVGGADHDQMEKMRQFMSQLCAGWDVETVKEIVGDTLHNIVDPLVYDEAVSLIEDHHLAGRDVIIVSTSGSEVVEPIGEMLGADKVIATRMEVARRQVHRRHQLLRVRREQGDGHPRPRRAPRLRPRAQLRLQRLGHRRVTCSRRSATPTRSTPTRTCGASRATAAGRSSSSTSRSRCARRLKLPPARQTIAALTIGGCRGDRRGRLAQPQAASRQRPEKSRVVFLWAPAYTGHNNSRAHTVAGTHAAIYPSYRALVRPGTAGGHS